MTSTTDHRGHDTVDRPPQQARLTLGHTTLPAQDVNTLVAFYRDVLGFQVTDRGAPGPGAPEMVFLSQDPSAHHQIVLVGGAAPREHDFVMADHLAFRTETVDDLRAIETALVAAGVDVIPICHGNSWSLYFADPEGNGLECFVDTPFHVPQPYASGLDLRATDEELLAETRAAVESLAGTRPFADWRAELQAVLAARGR